MLALCCTADFDTALQPYMHATEVLDSPARERNAVPVEGSEPVQER